jgi:hypothetical protein
LASSATVQYIPVNDRFQRITGHCHHFGQDHGISRDVIDDHDFAVQHFGLVLVEAWRADCREPDPKVLSRQQFGEKVSDAMESGEAFRRSP